jgi:hypothetical protein
LYFIAFCCKLFNGVVSTSSIFDDVVDIASTVNRLLGCRTGETEKK